MTQANTHIPEQQSTITDAIVSTLTVVTIVLAGLLSLAQFAVAVVA